MAIPTWWSPTAIATPTLSSSETAPAVSRRRCSTRCRRGAARRPPSSTTSIKMGGLTSRLRSLEATRCRSCSASAAPASAYGRLTRLGTNQTHWRRSTMDSSPASRSQTLDRTPSPCCAATVMAAFKIRSRMRPATFPRRYRWVVNRSRRSRRSTGDLATPRSSTRTAMDRFSRPRTRMAHDRMPRWPRT